MKNWRFRQATGTVLTAGLFAAVFLTTAAFLRRQVLPPATITTIARIPLGTAPGQLSNLDLADHIAHEGEPSLEPCDVDDAGNIYICDVYGDLYFFGPDGKPPKIVNQFALAQTNYLRHAPQALWAAGGGDFPDGMWGRLIKLTDAGQPVWEIGQHDSKEKRVFPGRPLPRPVPPVPYAPGSSPATAGQTKAETFGEAAGLFAADNGDAFVINGRGRLERFNKDGKFLGEYDTLESNDYKTAKPGLVGVSFSVLGGRDGIVYSHCLGRRSKDGLTTELHLERWTSPTQHTSRDISLAPLGPLTNIYLRAEDGKGNLYFQYFDGRREKHPRDFGDAMAIARVGPDGKAVEVFDIYAHYKDEIKRARSQPSSPIAHQPGDNIRVGDLLHASPNGDLYLEVCDGQSYRVDKISFSKASAARTP